MRRATTATDPSGTSGGTGAIYTFRPIGFVRSSFDEKHEAPRQPGLVKDEATIELCAFDGVDHAICDLAGFDHIWVLFVFDRANDYRAKVTPPRSTVKRGVFATRSPHRPNPLGLSVVRLDGVDGRTLRIRGTDMLDGTPVLDIKPYIAYVDARPDASLGWLGEEPAPSIDADRAASPRADPLPAFAVMHSDRAKVELAWLTERGFDLASSIDRTLSIGATPHPYRRIKRDGDAWLLSLKDWRVRFALEGTNVTVLRIFSGYRASQLYGGGAPELHREYDEAFGSG
jgi:tRNA-Thr(GGU) m(6)t(6)A37 methyltransferase TsaA